jgi:hypothetical protein
MAAQQVQASEPVHSVRLWKIGVYFALVLVFAAINIELFRELARTSYLESFTRVSELLSSAFDVVRRWDDILVTLFSLIMAFILTIPVGWTYILTKEEDGVDPSLAQTVVVLGLVVCGVMMLLQDNLARAFGLVGVVAAVRYRNTLRDEKDAVYVFLAIGVGMGCGLRAYHVALLLSIVICGVFLLLWKFRIGKIHPGSGALLAPPAQGGANKEGKKLKGMIGSPVSLGNLSTDVRKRVEEEIELQSRLAHLASFLENKEKGGKRPNAALIVRTTTAGQTQQLIQPVLADNWHLAHISVANGTTAFEYLGRVGKKDPFLPASLVEEIQSRCGTSVTGVEFRSLKGLKRMGPGPKGDERVHESEQQPSDRK